MEFKESGWILVVGALFFFTAAFNPSSRVFMADSLGARMEILQSRPGLWRVSQLFFGLGATVTALGVGLFAWRQPAPSRNLLLMAAGAMLLGALLWDLHCYQRAVDPEAFLRADLTAWLFPAYTLLTLAGLVMLGISLQALAFPAWLGYGLVAIAALMFLAYLLLGDLPPFFHYILTLVLGVVFI